MFGHIPASPTLIRGSGRRKPFASVADMLRTLTMMLALAACSKDHVPAGNGGLAWIAPATNADGSPLHDLAGFKLHYGPTGRGANAQYVYPHVIDIGMAHCVNGACDTDFDPGSGTTYVSITAYDTATPPNESAYSTEIAVTR